MYNFGEDACKDCGCYICRCPDDWLIQNEYEKECNFTFKNIPVGEQADYEELYLMRTFIIVKGLEEEFDKWVSERIESE